jgi:hypothetical protein
VLQTNFEEVYDQDFFEVVHVNIDATSAAALHSHWDVHNPTFPVLLDGNPILSQYGDGFVPYNVLLDSEGTVLYTDSGFSEQVLHNLIQANMSIDRPVFTIQDLDIFQDDNGDGRPDAGESVEFHLDLKNSPIAVPASNLVVTMTTNDASLTITNGVSNFPNANPGEIVGSNTPFTFTVAEEISPHWATFSFTYTADYADGTVEEVLTYDQRIGRPDLLLVDGDGGTPNEVYATTALDNLGLTYDLWPIADLGSPEFSDLEAYTKLIWLGGERGDDITLSEGTALSAFATEKRLLLVSSQFAGNSSANASLLEDLFGVNVVSANLGDGVFLTESPAGDPWFGGVEFVLTGSGGASNCTNPDQLNVLNGTASVLAEWAQSPFGDAASYVIDPDYNAIYCGFPIEAMRTYSPIPNSIDLTTFLDRVFTFHAANLEPPTGPDPVTDLQIIAGLGWASLTWSPVEGAVRYRLYASDNAMDGFTEIGWTNETFHFIMGEVAPHRFYQIRADND